VTQHVLVVHPDPTLRGMVHNMLGELGDGDAGFDIAERRATSLAAAESKAASEPVDLLITALEIPADDKSFVGVGEQRRLGIELVRTLRAKTPDMKAIIVTGQVDNDVYEFSQSDGIGLVLEGQKFGPLLTSTVKRLLGPTNQVPPAPGRPRRVVLSISLSRDLSRCSYQFQEDGGAPRTAQPFDLTPDLLERLVHRSSVHVKDPGWEYELKDVGETLSELLFYKTPRNQQFYGALREWMGKIGGIENIALRFTVDDTLHSVVVEAIRQAEGNYWMLQTAIYRGLEPPSGTPGIARSGLFTDEATRTGPLNILIIAADLPEGASTKLDERRISLAPLKNLAGEVGDIVELLAKLKGSKEYRIGEVRVLAPKELVAEGSTLAALRDSVKIEVAADGSMKGLVESTLRQGAWHIIHYAGHTFYDDKERAGYVFFPHSGGLDDVEPVHINEFALSLEYGDTRFVYLSSCSSANQDFIYQLARMRIPAVMGFLWEVNDELAREHAKTFYRCLFFEQENSLEHACLAAKKEMHAKHSDDPIWASSVLVIQVSG
jgi:CheY-like chemotaxis protein